MKTLSLLQPWATLVADGAKKVETRSWKTDYRGLLGIHASKGFPKGGKKAFDQLCATEPFRGILRFRLNRLMAVFSAHEFLERYMPMGALIATCTLIDCVKIPPHRPPPEPELSFGDYSPGRYAWYLENVKTFRPIPTKGKLGLWDWYGIIYD